VRWTLAVLVLAGCGSSWQIREGAVLEAGCVERAWYADGDGDGWGDGSAELGAGCEAPEDGGRVAANGRDCDDGSAQVTGRTGATCPDGLLAASAPISYGAALHDTSEYVLVYGEASPLARFTAAESACEAWSGADPVDGGWVPRGGLATFASQAERVALQQAVEAAVGEDGRWAGFVGIGWSGPLVGGAWAWVDGTEGDPRAGLPWCGNVAPTPEDFFPGLDPADPERAAGLEEELASVRLALALTDDGWCVGLPARAGGSYTRVDGHLLCERPAPDPADYDEIVPLAEAR